MFEKNIHRVLALSSLRKVGVVTIKKIMKQVPDWVDAPIEKIVVDFKVVREAVGLDFSMWKSAEELASTQMLKSKEMGVVIHFIESQSYPAILREVDDAPLLLYSKGTMNQEKNCIAVIGTRKPTDWSVSNTKKICSLLVERNASVVSGLALGCDAVAHQTAIEQGGHTVAVLAHGLHTVAPAANKKLAEKILESGGALVSQFPIGMGAKTFNFVERDKVQAGFSKGVILIQSKMDGGSMHAARAALHYGRWLATMLPADDINDTVAESYGANLCIAKSSDLERCVLLKCSANELSRIKIIDSTGISESLGQLL